MLAVIIRDARKIGEKKRLRSLKDLDKSALALASEASARVDDLSVSISATLMAGACNIGQEPLIRSHVPALTRHRLNWTKANYLRAETITSANARLVDFQATLLLAQVWNSSSVGRNDPDRRLPNTGQSTGFGAGPFIAEK